MVLLPTANGKPELAEPDVTGLPFTVIVAFGTFTVGVMVILLVEFGTNSVYVFVDAENAGLNVPALTTILLKSALPVGATITVIV